MYARVTAPHRIRFEDSPPSAELPPGYVEVELIYCGVCATDTHHYALGGMVSPSIFGHEWVGTVSRCADDVGAVALGQRVVLAAGGPCGRCAMCLSGHAEHCDRVFADATGTTSEEPLHGGFATSLVLPARRVMPVLDELSDIQAALIEPTAITFHAVRRTPQALGAVVVVQGAGPIGLLTAQHARHAGAGALIVVEPSPERRIAAEKLGFIEVHAPGGEAQARIADLSSGAGADVLYECTGVAEILQPSTQLIRRGGVVSLLGFPMTDSQVSYGAWQFKEITVVGSLAWSRADFTGAMRAIADGSVRVDELHTGTVPLDELPVLLEELASGNTAHAKVLVAPRASA
ncbi:alcohol dehydrogenase catalytic domain-containing protein [Agromyces mediolanus]|uniref:zinc-dependent alcohol dehydrogenase n=1 Tax=Agromyces mediolanus TaxID=41986 RepID=UPI003832D2C7